MQIRHLSIRNFRGIRELDWALPDRTLFCLIGRGDSTKSTILEALRCVFYPQWNLAFDDSDFYQCRPTNTICIDVFLGDIPDVFRDLETYGHWLSGWNATTTRRHVEPREGIEDALHVRLTVADDLEPKWRVIKSDDDEGVSFKAPDRAKVAVSLIGTLTDRHLTWSRGSLLGHLTEADNLSLSLADASRAAKTAMEAHRASLTKFDAVAGKAETTARSLGVSVSSSYRAHLDAEALSVHIGGLALHDGDMPLRRLGLGSKRMLTTGIQKEALSAGHITLFDELEIGLEPHRISRLVEHLKHDTSGQYILTTHSPVVLRELTVDDLHIVHCRGGKTEIVAANKPAIADSIQGKIRLGAEAFLAPKIVVCEGATEAGLLRGLDDHWIAQKRSSFAYQGVALFDARCGNKVSEIASGLRQLAYDVAVLVDSDADDEFSDADADALRAQGITVVTWSDRLSLEERVFADLPWEGVVASFELACAIRGDRDAVISQVQTQYREGFNRDAMAWTDTSALRTALGKAAKTGDWYKRQSLGQQWAGIICHHLDAVRNSDLGRKLIELREWIDRA
jgi:putative ATP-dependent endonuclease of OLD family